MGSKNISRGRLLKRAGAGAAALWVVPVLTSGARAAQHTCGRGFLCGVDPCFSQRACTKGEPGCSCIQRLAPNDPQATNGRRCFCHQLSSCASLTACTTRKECKERHGEDWECAASCCSYDVDDTFCHPACGTNAGGERPLAGQTSLGYIGP